MWTFYGIADDHFAGWEAYQVTTATQNASGSKARCDRVRPVSRLDGGIRQLITQGAGRHRYCSMDQPRVIDPSISAARHRLLRVLLSSSQRHPGVLPARTSAWTADPLFMEPGQV